MHEMTSIAREDGRQLPALSEPKTEVIAHIIRRRAQAAPCRILVVGCGDGVEAAVLASTFRAQVVGIDISPDFDKRAMQLAELRAGDATALEFPDQSFDLVYSYHALEHIPEYMRALAEMRRVLKKRGSYCVGTPNRARIVGYLGSKEATVKQKISWNLADWRMRLRGEFRNECGAHAGFTSAELSAALGSVFGSCEEVTFEYYTLLYRRHALALRMAKKLHLCSALLPSVYFVGAF